MANFRRFTFQLVRFRRVCELNDGNGTKYNNMIWLSTCHSAVRQTVRGINHRDHFPVYLADNRGIPITLVSTEVCRAKRVIKLNWPPKQNKKKKKQGRGHRFPRLGKTPRVDASSSKRKTVFWKCDELVRVVCPAVITLSVTLTPREHFVFSTPSLRNTSWLPNRRQRTMFLFLDSEWTERLFGFTVTFVFILFLFFSTVISFYVSRLSSRLRSAL